MTIDRRDVMKLGTALTLGSMIPSVGLTATTNDAFEHQFADVLARLRAQVESLGLEEVAAQSIVTGESYNGGLRHDFDQSAVPQGTFTIQPLARVEDVSEQDRPDVLPLFHEVGCHPPASFSKADQTRMLMQILTDRFGLDPARLAFVSVPASEDMRPVLDELGLPYAEKVLLRDQQEAFEARDGSGYFFPHPEREEFFVTMGVYYRIGDADEPVPASYPASANWTEIGEIVISGETAPPGISIGAERLTYAVTGTYPTWQERLDPLFQQVASDLAGGPQPAGIDAFK